MTGTGRAEPSVHLDTTAASWKQQIALLEEERRALHDENRRLEERARLAERLQARMARLNERFELLTRLATEVNALNAEKIFELCLTKVAYLLNAQRASVYVYDPEREKLFLKKHSHTRALDPVLDVGAEADTMMARAVRSGQVRVVEDLDRIAGGPAEADAAVARPNREAYRTSSCIVAPLKAGERIYGVLNLSDPIDGTAFTEGEDLRLVRRVAELIGMALRNCALIDTLQRQARIDSLTKLANHQTFFDVLQREVSRADRYGGELTVVMLDIDRFKLINDNAGHLAGDHVLGEVARIIRESVRRVDTAARYGGDEFALILPQSDAKAATTVAERIRERVGGFQFTFDGHQLPTTMSLGLAAHEPGLSASELVKRADVALYRAKREGGDRLRCH